MENKINIEEYFESCISAYISRGIHSVENRTPLVHALEAMHEGPYRVDHNYSKLYS